MKSTPVRLLLLTILCVFVSETLIMVMLSYLPHIDTATTIFIGSFLVVLCVIPILYLLLFRPLQKSLQEKIESETKFRLFADHTNDWEYLIGPDGKYIYLSSACERITGYSQEEFLSNPKLLFDIISPEYADIIANYFENINNENAQAHSIIFSLTKKNGELCWIENSCLPVFDENGLFIGCRGNNRDITKRYESEKALHYSKELYRLTFETASYLIISVDEFGTFIDCNKSIEKVLGYTYDEIIGQNMFKIIHPDFHKEAQKTIKSLIVDSITIDKEYKMICKDSRVIDVNISSSPITDSKGNFIRTVCIIDDITERKKSEYALRESEEKFHGMIQNLMVGFHSVTMDGVLLDYNKEFSRILKLDPNIDYTGVKVFGFWQDTRDRKEYIENLFKKGYLKDYVINAKNAAGESIVIQANPRLIKDENGNPLRIEGTFLDITKRKKTEESNILLSRAIEQADETIVITDSLGIIQYVNPAFEKTSGYTKDDAIGENPRILKSGQQSDTFYEKMWATLSNGKQWQGEIINKKKDGSFYTENVTISPVFDSHGKIINYVAAKNDITETKRLQELESRAGRLEMAGTIAGQVAHDFNNLLAPIMAYPEFIRDELPHDHKAQVYLDTIEDAAKKITEINQDLLTMGRRGHYNQDVININKIVLHAVNEMESRTKTVTCETELCEEILNIKGGSAQLHRMLTNLLVNAQDAMNDIGNINIKTENYYVDDTSISFGRVPKGEYIKLTVSDCGCGISDDIQEKILDPFFSTKSANKKSGSGLGLSVVDAVMKDHGGYLDMSSQVGLGTSFYLYFPITRDEHGESKSIEVQVGSEKVLIVDDDDVQRQVSSRLLNKLGYKVSSVESGEKALEFLKRNPQDILVLDMVMLPGIDGTETYKRVLDINPNQKAIIVSGFSESDRVFEAQKMGVGAFLRKPFTKFLIATAIRTELDKELKSTTAAM